MSPSCDSPRCLPLKSTANLGYFQYRCRACSKQFNERTGTPYDFLEYPMDVVVLTVFYYYRFKNSLVRILPKLDIHYYHVGH